MRTAYWFAVAFGLLLAAGLATVKYVVMPKVAEYRTDILTRVSQASGMDVNAKTMRGGWSGFTPFVEMEEVIFREPPNVKSVTRSPGATALALPLVRSAVSIPHLFIGQIRLAELAVFEPQLSLTRRRDGFIYFAGHAINKKTDEPDDGRFLDWLIDQPGIQIHRATLTWSDESRPDAELKMTDVGIQIDKTFGSHNIGFTATPPDRLAKKITISGRVKLDLSDNTDGRLQVVGTLFGNLPNANLTELRRYFDVPDYWQAGVGSVRAWVEIDNTMTAVHSNQKQPAAANGQFVNPIKAVAADVHIIHAKAQLGDDVAPLNIAKLAGRLEFFRHENGFTVGSKKLEFRTAEGVTSPPADFSFSQYTKAARKKSIFGGAGTDTSMAGEGGEVTANGIDLKVMTALIGYFPIGKDMRQLVTKFGMRGEVKASRFAWQGSLDQPTSYQIKGTLADFGVLPGEKNPGMTGFSGTIDGDDKRGVFTVASKGLSIELPAHFRAPLRFDSLDCQGKWSVTAKEIFIDFGKLAMANADFSLELSGKYSRPRAAPGTELAVALQPGSLDVTGKLRHANAVAVANYLPNGMDNTRKYIEWATRGGVVDGADFAVKGNIYDFPFHHGKGGHFSVKAKLKDIDFRYTEGWPQANKINGTLAFENTAMKAEIESAMIFGARIQNTSLAVADFAEHPSVLTIVGAADARAEDVARYLRESPMIDGIGAFTKVVKMEGPGKLALNLSIPLGVNGSTVANAKTPKFRISGNYKLAKGSAKPVVGPLISNLSGSIAFTETGVKSTAINGIAYGQPMNINIAGGGEAGVITDFSGRADVQKLGDVLPFVMPQQISGATDFSGRIAPKNGAVDITVDASMVGVTALLPAPLHKRADEARRVKVAFIAVGKAEEKIRISMLGNIATGGTSDSAATRIDARFQRRPDAVGDLKFYGGIATVGESAGDAPIADGIWLTGTLTKLNFDQWLKATENFYPTPSDPSADSLAPKPESHFAGIDFRTGQLFAYGRNFEDVQIKGRRTADLWAMSVTSKEVEGDFTWRAAAFNQRGAVRARLKKLVVIDESAGEVAPANAKTTTTAPITELAKNEGDLPALDIVADDFSFKGRWLGKLELIATPQVANWRIDQLTISNGHVKVDMNGIWQRYGDPFAPPSAGPVKSVTSMNVKLESSNLNALFTQFGYGDHMKGGRGGLEGTLTWPGHTYQFQMVNLSGAFKVHAERGQFAKIEAGAGKLLGLISLQSIPRRLTFDFRDLFSEGLAFDKIDGDITITDGIMFAKKFDISGPATDVKMTGDISLPAERQNLLVTVIPRISGVAAVGTAVLVNPLVGLGVLLGGEVLRAPIEKVLSVQYYVTGTWDNPVIEKTGKVIEPVAVPAKVPAKETVGDPAKDPARDAVKEPAKAASTSAPTTRTDNKPKNNFPKKP